METVCLDTHVIVWLFEKSLARFSSEALKCLEACDLSLPAIVVMELGLLHEIKRINYTPQEILGELRQTIGLEVSDASFESVAYASLPIGWTRDPFDRLIVADASLQNRRLVTKDTVILEHYKHAVW